MKRLIISWKKISNKAKDIDAPIKKGKLSFFPSGNTISSQNASTNEKNHWKRTENCLVNFLLLLKLEWVMCKSSSSTRPDESLLHYQEKAKFVQVIKLICYPVLKLKHYNCRTNQSISCRRRISLGRHVEA